MRDDDQDDDDHDEMTRDESDAREEYAALKKQLEADIAERAIQIKRDETRQWAEARNAEAPVTKYYVADNYYAADMPPSQAVPQRSAAPVPQRSAAAAPASLTQGWRDYIEARINRAADALIEGTTAALGDTLCKEIVATEKTCTALRADVDRLTTEIALLKAELVALKVEADARGGPRLRAVPSVFDRDAMIA